MCGVILAVKIKEVVGMSGKNLVNLQISIEEVENMDELVRARYYESRGNAKNLTEGILLSINRFVDESVNLKVRKVVGKKMNGKIQVNMQIAVEEIENVNALSEKDIMGVDVTKIKDLLREEQRILDRDIGW